MCFKMNFVIVWLLVLTYHLTQTFVSQENETIVIIDQRGLSSLTCCTGYQGCHCSNLSLALENIKNDTEIKLMSDISLEYVTQFGNISNVTLTGHNHTVRCNYQGGLVGENIINIVVQGVTWDKCNGIVVYDFTNAYIINSVFQHSVNNVSTLVLVGHASILISDSVFLYNDVGVYTFARFIKFYNSHFYGTTLTIDTENSELDAAYVTVTGSDFNGNSSILCRGTLSAFLLQLNINLSKFSNNSDSAVVLYKCHLFLLDRVTFYNNRAIVDKTDYICACGGGAICSCDSIVDINGSVYFLSNTAQSGGAVCLKNSNMTACNGFLTFHDNIANDKGGAITVYTSTIHINYTVPLEFVNNNASFGGAVYLEVDKEPHNYESIILYYYELLINSNHSRNSAADGGGNLAYFNYEFGDDCVPNKSFKQKKLFSSSPCSKTIFDAVVKVNISNQSSGFVAYWLNDLQFSAIVLDYFNNFVGPLTIFISNDLDSCNQYFYDDDYIINECSSLETDYTYTVDSIHNDVVLLSNNSIACSCLNMDDKSTITVNVDFRDVPFIVAVQWVGKPTTCNDIAHLYNKDADNCESLSCDILLSRSLSLPPGFKCLEGTLVATPGYWYDNGLHYYVISCPANYCNFKHWSYEILPHPFPDRDLQCKGNWKGFSCGECSHFIKYDSTDCILIDDCKVSSLFLSLIVLFVFSFFYWCLVIAFIFVLLHFNFNISAGYAFGIIFYYSVLEQCVSVLNDVVQARKCAIYEDYYFYVCDLKPVYISEILPFFSSIGNLKPPFMQYLKLCLGRADVIDHKFLVYIHPLIVFSIVVTIFLSARRFVFVARFFGRYINSKSISLLILLSYSSVSYTSVQLLRPLAYFKHNFNSHVESTGWRSYWSPHITYFHGRHAGYATIAILCEVIIGFGFPFLLLFQRYLTRHHNINFMSIRPIIDQLQACYRNECYWFSAYYLICRQVIYGVDIVCDVLLGYWMLNEEYIFAKFIVLLIVCSIIMVINIRFQPYRLQNLNVLDEVILLALLLLLFSSLDGNSWQISPTFWILPLVLFINYLTYSTKIQHVVVLISVCGLILVLNLMVFLPAGLPLQIYGQRLKIGVAYILYLSVLVCFLVGYILYMMTIVIKKICKPHNPETPLLADNIQNTSDEDDSD